MTTEELSELVLAVLSEIAPEIDIHQVDPGMSFRDQFDVDSVDFLNFVLTLEKRLGRPIPEVDYPKLSTLNGCIAYLGPQAQG
jgi:acyl carrier protein